MCRLITVRDDQRRPLARLIRGDDLVPAHRYTLRPIRATRLGNIDLAARGVDPHPEAGHLTIPEYGVLLDLQRLHHAH